MRKLYMIGNTHFDPVWLWKWDEAMASIRATFRAALDRMKEDPDFIYSFSTPPVFEWIAETCPEMLEEIRARVAEGRWELSEGWWLQPDCYSASGESYIRQGLYGQKYLLEKFGKISDTVFNIDSFGHTPSLPQILKKSHISNYCFVRPESRHLPLKHPLFLWEGIDGSKIPTYRAAGVYKETIEKALSRQENDTDDAMIVYGVTDHGGAPTKALLREIHALENARFSTVSAFFNDHKDELPTYFGELLTKDFGPYSNYPKIKRDNRLAEYAVTNAEKASLIAQRDDSLPLSNCWKDILFNQFHDILGGACIRDAYVDAQNTLGRATQTANEILHFRLQSLTSKIRMLGENPKDIWNLVLWNLNGSPFDGYVEAEVQWAHEFPWYDKGICLEDEHGNRFACQIIASKAVIPGFRSRFVFRAQIPSMGYKVFRVIKTEEEPIRHARDPFDFETNRMHVQFDRKSGTIHRVVDKKTKELLYSDILRPIARYDDGDTWAFNVDGYSQSGKAFTLDELKIVESGEIRTTVKATYTWRRSLLTVYYTFYESETYFDVRYAVNWNEKHYVLKLESTVASCKTVAAIPFGSVTREETKADVPMANLVRGGEISYLTDSIFSYNAHGGTLGLTVLRSPIWGDLRISDIDYDDDYEIMSQGITEGRLRITRTPVSHCAVDELINPPIVIVEANHGGTLPAEHSYLHIEGDGIELSAMKKWEYGNAEIIRVYESEGSAKNATLVCGDQRYSFLIKPYEIKTWKKEPQGLTELYMTEDEILSE